MHGTWPIPLLVAVLVAPPAAARAADDKDPLLDALTAELERSVTNLKTKGDEPLYYISYRVHDGRSYDLTASYGALIEGDTPDPDAGRRRHLDVSIRVGSPRLDNTHKVAGERGYGGYGSSAALPIDDDPEAIRVALWRATDSCYKVAVRQLINIKTSKEVKVEQEDKTDDFSKEEPHVSLGGRLQEKPDLEAWKDRLRRLSAIFKEHPLILSSSVGFSGSTGTMYFVDSEGARIREPRRYLRIAIAASVKADDGMDMDLYDTIEATTLEQLPGEAELAARVNKLIAQIEALRGAPAVEPYSGPAIIMNRAAAVFFHEIFGHRAEGHRLKDEEEGHTFKKKVGERILPEFVSVADDPTQRRFGETVLNGFYLFDEEGMPAQKVDLVKDGVLRGFLMGRMPVEGFLRSNGHGRAQPGAMPVARQGNLIVGSSKVEPFAELRSRLIEEVKRRGKQYGLMFQDIAGGFTTTGRYMPQAFKVIPLVVYRVYPDGRPDQLVRGVDLVGTPLQSLEKILATADDYAVFNGYCGAESGSVPVSAVSPSFLVAEMEVEKKEKGSERLPILPPPKHPGIEWPPGGEPAEPASGEADREEGPGKAPRSTPKRERRKDAEAGSKAGAGEVTR